MAKRMFVGVLISVATCAFGSGCGEAGEPREEDSSGEDTDDGGVDGSSDEGAGDGSSLGSGGAPGAAGSGGTPGTGGQPELPPDPVCDVEDPAEYELNAAIGGGGTNYETSAHFAVFGAQEPQRVLNLLEAAHQCFVQDWCWRSAGLSRHSDDGPHYKLNVYAKQINAGGYMGYDHRSGLSFIEVLPNLVAVPGVTVHEFGHSLTLTADGWVDQGNTGLWWESIANFVAESFLTSDHCAAAREDHGIAAGESILNLAQTIGNSHWAICNNQNNYEAWPFFTYLTNNPDAYAGLGKMVVPELFRNHLGNNETPLHVLSRLSTQVSVQTLLGRYWARMAYVDIGSPAAQTKFFQGRSRLNSSSLDSVGQGTYQVKSDRRPRYGGANIIPLQMSSTTVEIAVSNLGNGLSDSGFTATLAVLNANRTVRYVDLPNGSGQTAVQSGEEVSLVVVNTPSSLYTYNPADFGGGAETSHPANTGLNYRVTITGAAPR